MHLFEEFSPITAQQWKEQIVKDLKGVDFSQLMWTTNNGFDLKPFYTAEDLGENPAPVFTRAEWDVCEQIYVKDEKEANRRALSALNGGASGLAFTVLRKANLEVLLKDISLEHIYSHFYISNDSLHVLDDLKKYYGKVNPHDAKIKCFVNIDPLAMLATFGEWHESQEKDLAVLKRLVHLPVNACLYAEAGANTVNELAIGLAHLNEYFNYLGENKILENRSIHCMFAVKGDFFNEIAKFRAFRKLVDLLQQQYGTQFHLHLHAQTAKLNKSSLDAYTNMLRTTTEGMSAVIGGCDSLSILPFNTGFDKVSDFSSRIARNQQHILREESYLGKVSDISAGSYYIETLTTQLAQSAWEEFKKIESQGGYLACLKNNYIQDTIAKDAEKLLGEVNEGKMILVGVNKYQNTKEGSGSKNIRAKSAHQPGKNEVRALQPIRLAESFESENAKINTP